MRSTLEVLKLVVPVVGTLLGAGLGFVGGLRSSRVARHHARVETLYLEMLNAYDHQLRKYYRYLSPRESKPIEGTDPAELAARVELFAHPRIQSAWRTALDRLGERLDASDEMPDAPISLHRSDLWLIYKECLEALTDEMRADLGIPQHGSRRQRLRRKAHQAEWKVLHKWSGQ